MTTKHPIELIVTGVATLLVVLGMAAGARSQGAPKLSDFQLVPSKYNSSADPPAADSFPDRVASPGPRHGRVLRVESAGASRQGCEVAARRNVRLTRTRRR